MHIAVVDDYIQFAATLAEALAGTGHQVTGLVSPTQLREKPARPYDLALVDMDFSRPLGAPDATGLAALDRLAVSGVPAALFAMQEEENRALFLFAAFRFFRPLGLLDKHAPRDEVLRLLDRVASASGTAGSGDAGSGDAGSGAAVEPTGARYRTPAGVRPLIDHLLRSELDLALWQALTRHHRRDTIAKAVTVHPRTVDKFLAHQDQVVTAVETALDGGPHVLQDAPPLPPDVARGARLLRVGEFARLHRRFFHDPTLRDLIHRRDH